MLSFDTNYAILPAVPRVSRSRRAQVNGGWARTADTNSWLVATPVREASRTMRILPQEQPMLTQDREPPPLPTLFNLEELTPVRALAPSPTDSAIAGYYNPFRAPTPAWIDFEPPPQPTTEAGRQTERAPGPAHRCQTERDH